jgi:hypothetical protein
VLADDEREAVGSSCTGRLTNTSTSTSVTRSLGSFAGPDFQRHALAIFAARCPELMANSRIFMMQWQNGVPMAIQVNGSRPDRQFDWAPPAAAGLGSLTSSSRGWPLASGGGP